METGRGYEFPVSNFRLPISNFKFPLFTHLNPDF